MPPIDQFVGLRLALRRRSQGVSQSQLAEALGVTVLQVQAYEHGALRLNAVQLYLAAMFLKTPVSYFFYGLAPDGSDADETGSPEAPAQDAATRTLLDAFAQVQDPATRNSIVTLVELLARAPPVRTH